jgi:hypothetical protein
MEFDIPLDTTLAISLDITPETPNEFIPDKTKAGFDANNKFPVTFPDPDPPEVTPDNEKFAGLVIQVYTELPIADANVGKFTPVR